MKSSGIVVSDVENVVEFVEVVHAESIDATTILNEHNLEKENRVPKKTNPTNSACVNIEFANFSRNDGSEKPPLQNVSQNVVGRTLS